ncbi:MAG TPA: cytochrome c maturation protein CcmE [Dehalococcoidia bacterium]|nr:cytochrome c maturation protein CcmE [Dehalococcoidia bacterium]
MPANELRPAPNYGGRGARPQAGPPGPQHGLLHRKRFLIVGVMVAIALGYLGFTAFQGASMYYLTVDELLARGDLAYGEQVRLMGRVADGSVDNNPSASTLRFAVTGEDGASLPALYSGMVPDAFREDAEIVLEGTLTPAGTFQADSLLVKCPSKYEAAPEDQPSEDGS